MSYKFKGAPTPKKGRTLIKIALILVLGVTYFASYKYLNKDDNRIILDSITVDNGKK